MDGLNRFLTPALFLVAFLVACKQPPKDPAVLGFFPETTPSDTLHVEIAFDHDSLTSGAVVPNNVFFREIPAKFLADIDYLADSTSALVLAKQRFALNDSLIACLVEIRQFWFQHQSLLVYNKRSRIFTDRITLAEWYGGDGGQVLIGSWLFDYDGDKHRDIVVREIQHSMMPKGEEVVERNEESAGLFLWKNDRFVPTALADTASVVKRYPIQSAW